MGKFLVAAALVTAGAACSHRAAGGPAGGAAVVSGTGETGGGAIGGGAAGGGGVTGAGPFPASSIFYQDISQAPVDAESSRIMGSVGPPFRDGVGIDVSMTILTAVPGVARRAFKSNGDEPDCDTAPVPLPPGGNIENNTDYRCADNGDCHLLVYQGRRLYELYQANVSSGQPTGGTFEGGCLVVWNLGRDYWQPAAPPHFSRGDGCNGADAADMPMAPLLLTADDVTSGEVRHALRFTIRNGWIRKGVYVHPATHIGGPQGDEDKIPYGARLRLRGDYDLSTLPSEQARAVARALQRYGMFLADGGNMFISATTDVARVMSTKALRGLRAKDFEIVEGGTRYRWRDYQCQRTVVTD